MRLHHESSTEGRTLQALPIAESWNEQTLTWATQPATTGPPASVVAGAGGGYLRWDVTDLVGTAEHGFLIGDAKEIDPEGAATSRSSATRPCRTRRR